MNWKLRELQTTSWIYNPKSSVEQEIFPIFQHKVEGTPHLTQVTGNVHIYLLKRQEGEKKLY